MAHDAQFSQRTIIHCSKPSSLPSSRSTREIYRFIQHSSTKMLTAILIALLIPILLYYVKFYMKWKNGPPGPFPLPVLGNLLQVFLGPKDPTQAIGRFSKKYGDIFRLRVGFKDFVVMSSIDVLHNLSVREETLGRDSKSGIFHARDLGQNTGIVSAEGKTWEINRKWTFKTLHHLGLRKGTGVAAAIYHQVDPIIQSWSKKLGDSSWVEIDLDHVFLLPVIKVVFRLVMGDRINDSTNGAALGRMVQVSRELSKNITLGAGIDQAFPILGDMFPRLTGRIIQRDCHAVMRQAAFELIADVRKERASLKSPKKIPTTLTEAYLQHMEKNPNNPMFSDFHFTSIYMDILQAASETTTSLIEALILFSTVREDCQAKIYEEIVNTIPEGEPVALDHRNKMPYTEAFMLETHRTVNILANLVPRRAKTDVTFGNYVIPEDTILIADMHSANKDTRIWDNPSDFDPDRFLSADGQMVMDKRRQCLPFGAGRRSCPGEPVAEWTSFLFLINILRTFKLRVVPGEDPPTTVMNVGVIAEPFPFKLAISKRNLSDF